MGRWTTTAEAPSEQTFELRFNGRGSERARCKRGSAASAAREGATRSGWTICRPKSCHLSLKGPAPNPAKIQILSHMFPGKSCCTSNVER